MVSAYSLARIQIDSFVVDFRCNCFDKKLEKVIGTSIFIFYSTDMHIFVLKLTVN